MLGYNAESQQAKDSIPLKPVIIGPGLDKSKFDLLVRCCTSATKYCISVGFPIYLIHFSGQVRKYFTCPAKIFTCPGQPDNGFVRP